MKVPRGTPPLLERTWGHVTDYFKVRAAHPDRWELDAIAAGIMSAARVALAADNCAVNPGTFEALDLESGRARRESGLAYLRARCRFPSGGVRVVTVSPTFYPGDLFWIRGGDRHGARKASRFTLEVEGVDIARLRDMTDADALACGAALLPEKLKDNGTPREWFKRSRPVSWEANGWVWVVRFKTHRRNVDDLLAEWGAS